MPSFSTEGRPGRTLVYAVALAAMVAQHPASAGTLPEVASGARPGPDVLYAPPPAAPQLENHDPRFTAPPILVSGHEAYVAGEYLYQDFLYDDFGSDVDNQGNHPLSGRVGDITYPTDTARYANNAADLVEFRIAVDPSEVTYRVTLNTLLEADSTIVAIAFDTDQNALTGLPTLPRDPGALFPGTDEVIFAWGTGAEHVALPSLTTTPLAITVDLDANQLTVTVPRTVSDPSGQWRTTVATGLYDTVTGGWLRPQTSATATTPGGAGLLDLTPAGIFNLAFRFDEPVTSSDTPPDTDQAVAIRNKTPTVYAHAIDFDALDAGTTSSTVPATGVQVRIFASRLALGEGRELLGQAPSSGDGPFPQYRGQLQSYSLFVPAGYTPGTPAGFILHMHSLDEVHWQYNGAFLGPALVNQQMGDQLGNLLATPAGRGRNGWYQHEGEYDVFEVWSDVSRHFTLDPDRLAMMGYSMGGYGTYRLCTLYPDLCGKAFTTVGPPGDGIWLPPAPPSGGIETLTNLWLENARNVPYLNAAAVLDELVPLVGPTAQNLGAAAAGVDGFEQLGYRFRFLVFPTADHLAIAALGYDYAFALDFLDDTTVDRDPPHVTFSYLPATDDAALDLVHDHAYWISEVTLADPDNASPGKATVDAFSHGHGEGDPASATGADAGAAGPLAYTETNRSWGPAPAIPVANQLDLTLANVASVRVDLARASLDPQATLTIPTFADGGGTLHLDGSFPSDSFVLEDDVVLPGGSAGPGGAVVPVASGSHTYVITTGAVPTPVPTPAPLCAPVAATGCRLPVEPDKGLLLMRDREPDKRDRLIWKWLKGAATPKADFGAPLASTSYAFCLYDASGTLVTSAFAPAGGSCSGKPCWKEQRRGFKYRRRDLTPSGTKNAFQLQLKEGTAGKPKVIVKGKAGVPPLPALPIAQPLTAQVVSSDGRCWESTFSAPARVNEGDQFKDKAD